MSVVTAYLGGTFHPHLLESAPSGKAGTSFDCLYSYLTHEEVSLGPQRNWISGLTVTFLLTSEVKSF